MILNIWDRISCKMPNWDTFECEISDTFESFYEPTRKFEKAYVMQILTWEHKDKWSFISEHELDDTVTLIWTTENRG